MKKKIFKSLCLVVLLITFLTGSVMAYASSADSSYIYKTVNGYNYKFNSTVVNNSSSTWAYTNVGSADMINLPTGYMGAYAGMYSSSDVLKAYGDWYYNDAPHGGISQMTSSVYTLGTYYSYGQVKLYNGNGYTTYSTYKSPVVSNASRVMNDINGSEYQINSNGETYGKGGRNAMIIGKEPDLIEASGTDGTIGYVKATELASKEATTIEEAISITQQNLNGRTINLYDYTGENVIGSFDITPAQVETVDY